uniref:Uncharacterized protein n=1 Tax=Lepeophtheirus salmonis TaxID=72036 RepID=A0A0K2TSD5_LEPSM
MCSLLEFSSCTLLSKDRLDSTSIISCTLQLNSLVPTILLMCWGTSFLVISLMVSLASHQSHPQLSSSSPIKSCHL